MKKMNHSLNKSQKICVSIAAGNTTEAMVAAKLAASSADVLEIRLDSLADAAVTPFIEGLQTPLLFTNRPTWEGGQFEGKEEERIALLIEAARAGAAYVDIELRTEPSLRDRLLAATTGNTKTIVSWHDFSGTPTASELSDIIRKQQDSGGSIGKLVTTASSFRDVLRVLDLQTEATDELNFPLIAFCMGRPGMISRIATLELGGFMTYAAPDKGQATAPGQLPAATLHTIIKNLKHPN